MKKFIISIFIFALVLIMGKSTAQINTLVTDTVCIDQDVNLTTSNDSATSYYWGTCSGWLPSIPIGGVIANGVPLNGPTPISLNKDGNNYFVFALNTNGTNDLLRYDFSTSLQTIPTPVNLSNFGAIMPANARALQIVKVNGNWYGFVVAGTVNCKFIRLDFGTSLTNYPVATDFGNLAGLLINPQDIHFFEDNGNYYAYTFNATNGNILRLDFGANISSLPVITIIPNPDPINIVNPTGFTVTKVGIDYYMFVVNRGTASISRLDFGTSMLNVPVSNYLGTFGGAFSNPRDISIATEDNKYFAFITNEIGGYISRLSFGNNITSLPTMSNLGNFSSFNAPRCITTLMRDTDNIYGFVSNFGNNTISKIQMDSSTNATILKSYVQNPPTYQYTVPGTYNIYLQTTNNGILSEDQKQIVVLPKPTIDFHQDTLICQGDTIFMVANGNSLSSVLWNPTYNLIPKPDTTSVWVYPEEDYRYNVRLSFLNGCIMDTSVMVKVSKIKADAGPDITIADGASAVLGGPKMSLGYQFTYSWTPFDYLNDDTQAFPITQPTDTLIYYYLQVTNTDGCKDYDTVLVKAFCGDINAPNAFNPTSIVAENRTFGIANYQLKKLDYFRVFNRYGQMVFETTNPAMKWDGTFNGVPQPSDTYIWVGLGICNNGRKVQKNGNVLLVR